MVRPRDSWKNSRKPPNPVPRESVEFSPAETALAADLAAFHKLIQHGQWINIDPHGDSPALRGYVLATGDTATTELLTRHEIAHQPLKLELGTEENVSLIDPVTLHKSLTSRLVKDLTIKCRSVESAQRLDTKKQYVPLDETARTSLVSDIAALKTRISDKGFVEWGKQIKAEKTDHPRAK